MKRVLIVLGAIFGVVLVVAAAGIVFVIINGNALDKESQAYADETIPTIAQHWDQDEIAKRASPEFLKATKDDNFPKLLSMLRDNLGDFRKFDKAPATIQLKLIKHSDEWQILGFHVDSQAFLRP
jgi:hypothetical protein